MIVPKVVIFGIEESELEKVDLDRESITILNTYQTSQNLKQIIIDHRPDIFVTIGESWKDFPEFGETPFFIKRRWLHYSDVTSVKTANITHCYMKAITVKNSDYPLITVFTTTYKSAHKIQRPYRSLMLQTYKDWEWVIMDDSDDDGETYEMLKKLGMTDYRIRLYKDSEHSGYIGKMKRDVAMMGYGDILIELDHDDDIMPRTLEYIKDAFASDPEIGMVYSDYTEIYESGQNFKYSERYAFGYGSYLKTLYNGRWVNVAQSVPFNGSTLRHIVGVPNHIRCWRAEAYRKLSGHNPHLHVADDYELILRTFLNYKVCRIPKFLYIQYRNAGGNNFTFIRNREIQKLSREVGKMHRSDVINRLNELGVYSTDTDYAKDWEKSHLSQKVKRGAELIYNPNSDRISIVLVAEENREELIESIRSVINQTEKNWYLYVIGAGSSILEEVMEEPDFKRHDIFWWNLENVETHLIKKTCLNYALKMIVTTDMVTYIRAGIVWDNSHLSNLIGSKEDNELFETNDTLGTLIHDVKLLSVSGYYDESDSEFISRLEQVE